MKIIVYEFKITLDRNNTTFYVILWKTRSVLGNPVRTYDIEYIYVD